MDYISIKARAKINLSLDVVGKRSDGYHEVRMIMQSIGLCDELTICRIKEETGGYITVETDSEDLKDMKSNLVFKAAEFMREECGIDEGIKIELHKNIPIAAGMAGGSTDAAAVLNGINELFGLKLSKERLCELGVRLGADIPYCIMGGTVLSEGIGEVLTPLTPMPDCSILIAKPGISVSTGYVYNAFDSLERKMHPDVDAMRAAIERKSLEDVADLLGNSLEGVTEAEYPIIGKIKKTMLGNGAIGSLMSGSGPTVFGLYRERAEAEKAAEVIRAEGTAKDIIITEPR